MHPADIKAHLEKAGKTQSDVARMVKGKHGKEVTPGAVWLVVKGTMASAAIAKGISRVTGVPVSQLWPGRYPQIEEAERADALKARRAPRRGATNGGHA